MRDIIKLLLTGCGAPGTPGTVYALRNNEDLVDFYILGTDINSEKVGKYLVDDFITVPRANDKNYLKEIGEIVESFRIDAILPQTTAEVEVLSKSGLPVICSNHESVKKSNDKYLLLKEAEAIGIPVPKYELVRSPNDLFHAAIAMGYPDESIVIKPRVSCGMRGLRILCQWPLTKEEYLYGKPDGTRLTIKDFSKIRMGKEYPELLVTEHLPGQEYTVDCFGIPYVSIPRERNEIRSGISFNTKVVNDDDLINYSNCLAERLGLEYCFGFQFKEDSYGVAKLLECNPRVQGTMVASYFAGFNIIYNSVKRFLGEDIKITKKQYKEIEFKRYWGGVCEGTRI